MASLMMKLLFLCLIAAGSISFSLGAEAEQLTSEGRSKEKNIHPILHMPAEIDNLQSPLIFRQGDGKFRKIVRKLIGVELPSSPPSGQYWYAWVN
ncbi:hypothetical protein MANES_07G029401v8 [Manihot esculenta]|uniref:Uncharacterized protein n=1 Tax=Manihot esculenta TaxID=3983 RepID=A0ACC8DCH5_MANES|nr:hypothetical protein MANES_07G029401v8 [Manihot esculenta]